MKRLLSLALVLLLTVSICGCGKKEAKSNKTEETEESSDRVLLYHLTEFPTYVLPDNATADDMRKMSVKAMNDALSFQWFVKKDFEYGKSVSRKQEVFEMHSNETYAGLPYTAAASGLLHYLQFYNFETGEVSGMDWKNFEPKYGNSCAAGVMWGWSSCTTTYKGISTTDIIQRSGLLTVGPYTYDKGYSKYNFNANTYTDVIAKKNGEQVMYQSYAACKPADALVTVPSKNVGDHAVMVIMEPHVEYNSDGTIDGTKSYLIIQDQRAGHRSTGNTYVIADPEDPSYIVHYAGRTSAIIKFNSLYNDGYLPHTMPEFIGKKAYVVPTLKADNPNPKTFLDFSKSTLRSEYKIIAVTVTVSDKKTKKEIASKKTLTIRADINSGKVYKYKLNSEAKSPEILGKLKKGNTYNFKISAMIATGQTFTPVDVDLKYE